MSHLSSPQRVALVGFGAIGRSLLQRAQAIEPPLEGARIEWVVVRDATAAGLPPLPAGVTYVSAVPSEATAVLEAAGHSAVAEHVLPALARGVACAMLSIGALADDALRQAVQAAAQAGQTRCTLLPGALGAVDALAAAKLGGLDAVQITQRKPPRAWKGTTADGPFDLDAIAASGEPTVILQGSTRESARLYPKNANVSAMVAFATLGLDATQVRLVADPGTSQNVQEIEARGAFGDLRLVMNTQPLADNPKTSALTVLSALRWLRQQDSGICI